MSALDLGLKDPASILELREQFARQGYAELPSLFPPSLHGATLAEARGLLRHGSHRQFLMPPYGTLRHMTTVGGAVIAAHSTLISSLHDNPELRELVQNICGREIYACTHPQEKIVINSFSGEGETHGWHFDDPEIALVLILEAPAVVDGGQVELVDFRDLEHIPQDHEGIEAIISQVERLRKIERFFPISGSAYLLNASRILHRVAPIARGSRLAINFAYSYSEEQRFGRTADLLYGDLDAGGVLGVTSLARA